VAVLYGWDVEEFLGNLCLKADLQEEDWRSDEAELLSFETEVLANS